jgi:hypothetical protein
MQAAFESAKFIFRIHDFQGEKFGNGPYGRLYYDGLLRKKPSSGLFFNDYLVQSTFLGNFIIHLI